MSRFTRINTKHEQNKTHSLLIAIKNIRIAQRKKSLLIWAKKVLQECTSPRTYLTGYRGSARGLRPKQKSAWRYDKNRSPHKAIINGRDFTEIVLSLKKLLNGIAITIESAHISYPKEERGIYEPITKFVLLGKIIILTPETQKGRCVYGLGANSFSQEKIDLLLKDLGINVLNRSRNINAFSDKFPVIAGITEHDIYFLGKCMLI